MLLQLALFHSFKWLSNILLHVCATSSLSIYLTFRLLSFLGYFKLCCKEHWGGYFLSDRVFLQIYAQEWDCSIIW